MCCPLRSQYLSQMEGVSEFAPIKLAVAQKLDEAPTTTNGSPTTSRPLPSGASLCVAQCHGAPSFSTTARSR